VSWTICSRVVRSSTTTIGTSTSTTRSSGMGGASERT
jgi:hypothetical protein